MSIISKMPQENHNSPELFYIVQSALIINVGSKMGKNQIEQGSPNIKRFMRSLFYGTVNGIAISVLTDCAFFSSQLTLFDWKLSLLKGAALGGVSSSFTYLNSEKFVEWLHRS